MTEKHPGLLDDGTSERAQSAAVIDDLLRVYEDLDLFEEAILGAYKDTERKRERPRLEAELASAQSQLRETTLPSTAARGRSRGARCLTPSAPRGWPNYPSAETSLTAAVERLRAQVDAGTPQLPSRRELDAVGFVRARGATQ